MKGDEPRDGEGGVTVVPGLGVDPVAGEVGLDLGVEEDEGVPEPHGGGRPRPAAGREEVVVDVHLPAWGGGEKGGVVWVRDHTNADGEGGVTFFF